MASDYDAIRNENIRNYGEKTHHLAFLGRLYTDRTHFIFELLQNAEDACATRILFEIYADRLEVRHDGRLFNEEDVLGVCGVGEGTKEEDLTQIGKFGIGFKSVYAYTTVPEIHCGDEHFRIENYIRPYAIEPEEPGLGWTTLFVFGFDHPDIAPEDAATELTERLKVLSGRTLLFLRNLKEIEYCSVEGTRGIYLRESTPCGEAREVTVIGQNGGEEEDETWLVFWQPVSGAPVAAEKIGVEIAFKLSPALENQPKKIVKIQHSPLFVYFPTEKSTGFGFLAQGPYRTTPARDNVPPKDRWNIRLVEQTAELLVAALLQLREMGLLSVSLLETLPIRRDDFLKDSMFYSIYEALSTALKEQELLPADNRTFVAAKHARLARSADLRKLLPQHHLRSLLKTEEPLKWLSGEITQDRTPDLRAYLIRELGVNEIDPDSFARSVSADFLSLRDDDWFVSLYSFLADQPALWRASRYTWESPLRAKEFIRLEDGSLVAPFDEHGIPKAYLVTGNDTRFPAVRQSVASTPQAHEFLIALGLTEPDILAELAERILPKYASGQFSGPEAEYLDDLNSILAALTIESQEKKSKALQLVRDTPFLRCTNAASYASALRKPKDAWVQSAETLLFFEDNPDVWFVDESIDDMYRHEILEIGVYSEVAPRRYYRLYYDYVLVTHKHGQHKRGLKRFDPKATVLGLKFALEHHTLERSRFIWNKVLALNYSLLCGEVEEATRADFSNSTKSYEWSEFGKEVCAHAWIPTIKGDWKRPSDMQWDEFHADFTMDAALLRKFGIEPPLAQEPNADAQKRLEHAEALGIMPKDLEMLDLLKKYETEPGDLEDLLKLKDTRRTLRDKPEFPTKVSRNPEHRKERRAEQYAEAPTKEYEQRSRSVRTTRSQVDPNAYLPENYTNGDGQLICQICKEEMPFKKRDDHYYFEAVEALSNTHFRREDVAQFLALCPVCAAMYKEFVKCDEATMGALKAKLYEAKELEVQLSLGQLDTTLQFVQDHFDDLKAILAENDTGPM